jgi:hypothetical protein
MNRYGQGNETVAGLGHGTFADVFRTQVNTGLNIQYNDAFLGSLGNYQAGLETLRAGNTSQLMAQEGAISERLLDMQTGRQLASNRYVADRNLAGVRYNADRDLMGNMYTADRSLESNKYTADRSLESNKYTADRGLEGVRYGYDSQERQIGLQGTQDRLTKSHETDQALRMRADARGAIRSQGARFYG